MPRRASKPITRRGAHIESVAFQCGRDYDGDTAYHAAHRLCGFWRARGKSANVWRRHLSADGIKVEFWVVIAREPRPVPCDAYTPAFQSTACVNCEFTEPEHACPTCKGLGEVHSAPRFEDPGDVTVYPCPDCEERP